MGTTRIGENPSTSVCDFEFKIHNTENLYINSSSLFPSGGIANPTLTLIALLLFLLKANYSLNIHLAKELKKMYKDYFNKGQVSLLSKLAFQMKK